MHGCTPVSVVSDVPSTVVPSVVPDVDVSVSPALDSPPVLPVLPVLPVPPVAGAVDSPSLLAVPVVASDVTPSVPVPVPVDVDPDDPPVTVASAALLVGVDVLVVAELSPSVVAVPGSS